MYLHIYMYINAIIKILKTQLDVIHFLSYFIYLCVSEVVFSCLSILT